MGYPYPTDREVIRELMNTAHDSFERGYEAGKADMLDKLKYIVSTFHDPEEMVSMVRFLVATEVDEQGRKYHD